jgi:hypothetical protein
MYKLFRAWFATCFMLATVNAHAGGISDVGVNAYWGSDSHGNGDLIGGSTYDINGATITRVGSVLTVTIATNFAGHAGSAPGAAPNGIGYGDVFLSQLWNPFGTDAHHSSDNAANGTKWTYGFNLDNRWNNDGGTFKLYKLNGATNAANVRNSEDFMTCTMGTQCTYRNGQATAVKTTSSTVQNTGLVGNWTVTDDQQIKFSINISSSELMNFSSFAMHWGETCQNDVVEGITSVVPTPGSLPLLGLGLGAMWLMGRRRTGKPVQAS